MFWYHFGNIWYFPVTLLYKYYYLPSIYLPD